jgi:beta-glucosidase
MKKHFTAFLILLTTLLSAQTFQADIAAFKNQDRVNPPKKGSILFTGSSSFTMWKDYQRYFPNFDIINRGFGGSTLADQMTHYKDATLPYQPRQIVMYCGENDFANDEKLTPKDVFARFVTLFEQIRRDNPTVQVSYISMKPGPSRVHLMPKYKKGNELIRKYLLKQTNTSYIDVYSKMLDAQGKPRPELFLEDMLHMNEMGYKIWQSAMAPALLPSPEMAKMNKFINELMGKMTLEEKIGQLNLITPGSGILTGSVVSTDVENKVKTGKVGGMFGIIGVEKIRQAQEMAINNSRLKIPMLFGSDVIHGHKTTFPLPLAISCSWDMDLIKRSAQLAAQEATADGLNWTFSPMVDIARDPRWGRISEGSGEDVYLGSKIAKAMVEGYQGDDLSKPNTMLACVKHYALYGAAEAGRDYNTTDMSRVRMFNEYMPPYKAAIDAGVATVMTSFNEIDGIPATGNKWLLTDILREQWGFNGMVVTDYTSINEMTDHGMGDLQTVSALAMNAGVDMDMVGEGFLNTLQKSIKEGKTTVEKIENSCRNILIAKYKLGLFDDPYRYCNLERSKKEVWSKELRDASRMMAGQSFVLLKNEKQLLPLQKTSKIALIGPLADSRVNMNGTWAVSGDFKQAVTIKEGIENAMGKNASLTYAKGANLTDDPEMTRRANVFGEQVTKDAKSPAALLEEAVAIANQSDVIVAVVGESADMTGEASSRVDLGLSESQMNLLKALSKTGKPVVMVLLTGRPLTLTWENDNLPAILNVWFGGTEMGNAVADAVFGAVNPSGKLTTTFPRSVGQIPLFYNMKNTGRPQDLSQPNGKFRSNYLDMSNLPLYPFGYGLSYTNFTYSDIALSKTKLSPSQTLEASVTLTNSGKYEGAEVVQLYIRDVVGTNTRPMKELKGFQKVNLKAGESKKITFNISTEDLKFYNNDLKFDWEDGEFEIMIGGNSADVKKGKVEWTRK